MTVIPGIYWCVVLCRGSDEVFEFAGTPSSGYFIPYFGLKGQDL